MTAFVGMAGNLLTLEEVDVVDITQTRPRSERMTLDGTINEQRGKTSRRQWNIGLGSSTAAELASLQALELGAFGPPPWVWVEPYAQVTSLLSPEQAVLLDGSFPTSADVKPGGAGITADGIPFGRSVNITNGADVFLHYRRSTPDRLAVRPKIPVVGSVYASGNAYLKIEFFNAVGTFIGEVSGAAVLGNLSRRITAAVAPDGSATAQLRVYGATQLTLPAFTWTREAAPWAVGRGCNRVSLLGLSEAVEAASVDVDAFRRSAMKLTARELG
ncbi:hypothetical protein ACX80O_02385 [Arthrobacter sp. Hz1]